MRARAWMMVAACVLQAGCGQLGYYAQAARGQLQLLAKREPIQEVLADPDTPQTLRQQLELVLEARDFASRELALPENDSYRSYADLERSYVVWNLFAAAEFSVEPESWCFPIVGCVAYKGYFSERKAREAGAKLAADGFDVYVTGIAAYSTLGRFDDPFLNTMLRWDRARMAGLIFHELAHQQLYLKGETDFNEAFATVIEEEGVKRWLKAREDDEALDAWRVSRIRHHAFVTLAGRTREALRELYGRDLPEDDRRAQKALLFERMREQYDVLKASWGNYDAYDAWFADTLNNAKLASVATYRRLVPAFRALLADARGDMAGFYAGAAELAALSPEARRSELRALMARSEFVPDEIAGSSDNRGETGF